MTRSIRLHPEYGVNPTLPVCLYCGKETGEIAMLGAAYKKEAPLRMLLNYDPCPACRAAWAQGVVLIEVDTRRDGWPVWLKSQPDMAPTGAHLVVTEDWVRRSIHPPELRDNILQHRRALMTKADFRQLVPEEKGDEQAQPG